MRMASKVVLIGAVVGALGGAVLGTGHFAGAQSQGGSQAPLAAPTTVSVVTPDGGPLRVGIDDAVRLDVSSAQPEGTTYAVSGLAGGPVLSEVTGLDGDPVSVSGPNGDKLNVEVTGLAGGAVLISGPVVATVSGTPTFALPSSTLSLLAGQRNCAYTPLNNPVIDGGVITEIVAAPGQTGIMVTAHDFGTQVDFVSCWPSDTPDGGPLPNCLGGGVGYPIHNHDTLSLDISSTNRIRCVACAHGSNPAQNTAALGGGISVCTP